MQIRTILLLLLRAAFLGRHRLVLENLALPQQLAVLKCQLPHPRTTEADRLFWLLLRTVHDGWRDCLHLVSPATVVRWHRQSFRWHWGLPIRGHKQGRPTIGWKLFRLIRRLQEENPTWGAPRITSELRLLGHEIGQSTVSRYMARVHDPRRSQGWTTFIRNTMKVTAACDFFVVPTLTFKLLYGFVVLSHDRRRILHVGVTAHPTAEWTAQQLREAFPGDGTEPRFLLRDNDAIYGESFEECVRGLGLTQLLTAYQSPWQTPYVERVIGTIRRECLDHILPLGERHLLRTLNSYIAYYNTARTHQSLEGDSPMSRPAECEPAFELISEPVLGGLHNRYRRAG